jgi:murein DD-endopeptidase MepM/ murein hydrolase activator NlpD
MRASRAPVRALQAVIAVVAITAASLAIAPEAHGQDGELAQARERANQAAAELNAAESQAAELETQAADAQRRIDEAEAALGALRVRLRQTAIDAYVGAGSSPADAIVMGDDLNRQAQAQALVDLVTQSDADAIDEYRVASEEASIARADLDAALGAQREAVDQLEQRRAALQSELARLEELERQRLAAEEAARQAAAQEAARQAALAAARGGGTGRPPSVAAPSTPIVTGSGFICPVQGAVSFVDSWGAPRSGGRRHQGVDMMSPEGTPTVAPVSGTVSHRGNSLGGMSWYVDGDDGNLYYGTHLSAYANEGAGHVSAGTVIGYVGHTGNASANAPHLHFEIRPGGGSAVNPYPTVRAAC